MVADYFWLRYDPRMQKNPKPKKRILRGREKGIMLEDLDARIDLVVEVVKGSEGRLTKRMDEMETALKQDIADIHLTVSRHSEKIQKHDETLQRHEEEISILKESTHH